MSSKPPLHALIFGASGITGWGIARATLSYPTPETFDRVIGLTNRPMSKAEAILPDDPRLVLFSGVDLSKSVEDIVKALKNIAGLDKTTHVYFSAYIHSGWGATGAEERRVNVDLLVNTVKAVEIVCPDLQFWTLQTGGKWYGFEFGSEYDWKTPLRESAPRVPSPFGDTIFYYPQFDALAALSKGKKWKFADIRPDAIVGFVPKHNPMNIAEPMALYLSLWKSLSPSKPVPFPGNKTSWTHLHSDCSQDLLGRFTIFASLHGEKTAGKSYNVSDGASNSWEMVWPGICKYFGLKGVGPLEVGSKDLSGESWVKAQKSQWDSWTAENGLRKGVLEGTAWGFMTTVAGPFSEKDRHYDISESEKIGFLEKVDHVKSYHGVFDTMRMANIIPKTVS